MLIKRSETGYQLENVHVTAKPFSNLPTQQARTLLLVANGFDQKTIAFYLGLKVSTIKKNCSELAFKFNTRTMRQTVHQAIKSGVIKYTLSILLCLFSASNTDLERSFRTARSNRITRYARAKRLRQLQTDFLNA